MAFRKLQVLGIFLTIISLHSEANTERCDSLTINGGSNSFPYFYRNGSGHFGIVGDTVITASNRIAIKPVMGNKAPWKRILFDLKNGNIDVVAGTLKTKEREKLFFFSSPVYYSEYHIFVRKNSAFKFNALEDLKGRRGIKIRGMSLGQELDEYAFENLVIEEVTDTDSLFKMVAAKRVDFGIFYLQSGFDELKRLKLNESLIALPHPLTQQPLYVAFSKKSRCPEAIQHLSAEIDLMKKDGSAQAIADRYAEQISNARPASYTRPVNDERVIHNHE
ncbi:substrate-binding periplasmic protein [Alkalimarinus alittae]|uniref:Transporter substrate-binding domain-containing protein n=1 Tax=Alkalimarinus alittae TaxID=2961619 RepID=A0ABY6N1N6_9ALTE|nr:transporter substrate-binding domain-containing protein [Alkalimarinus alittae]UZE96027.1 transporter substrate-binding domain-containing protein [Alkalimarinus alittae]